MIDCHLHSERSHDARGSVSETCLAALEMGLSEICFTEHVDFEPADPCYGYFDYELSRRQIEEARDVYGDRLTIGFGAEFDFQVKYLPQIAQCLDGLELDYVIGAVHYVDGVLLERHEQYFPGKTDVEAYRPYFESVIAMVGTGLFDTVAHFDLCKRHGVRYFGAFDPEPFSGMIDEALHAVIERGMSLEINSSGLRQAAADTYPCRSILQRYHELGGRRITLGSDSHSPETVGCGIAKAVEIIRSVGFDEIGTYQRRKRFGKAI